MLSEEFEKKVGEGYSNYLEIPTYNEQERMLYNNGWVIFTGTAFMEPHPHRHYNAVEFVYNCAINEELYDYFLRPLLNVKQSKMYKRLEDLVVSLESSVSYFDFKHTEELR